MSQVSATPKLLFVCVENSNRSQMAEAFARIHGSGSVEAFSAGSNPSGKINPKAVAAMQEKGYDLSRHEWKSLQDVPQGPYEYVITMGCGDACPVFPGKRYLDWELEDPAGKGVESVRPIRDEIGTRIRGLLAELLPAR